MRVDKKYSDTWETRNNKLGVLSYAEYLNSDYWKALKAKTKRRKRFQKCLLCNETNIELHHTSYKKILTPHELHCIIPLCRIHHQEIHDYAKLNSVSVRVASNKIIYQYKDSLPI